MSASDPAARTNAVIGVLAGGGIMVSLMQTLVVPLIPELPRLLHTSESSASWMITATLLTAAVATPVVGRLGDIYGKRRLLLVCALLLTAGSLVCAVSSALIPVVAGRALQGMGIPVIPLGISIMRDVVPPERLGSAIALMSSSLGVGGALGLPASAAVAQHFGWHALFWGSAVLGALLGLLVLLAVPASAARVRERFDVLGAAGLSAGLAALMLAISKGGDWGWGSRTVLGLFAAALAVLLGWAWWELRVPSPVVDLRTSARQQVLMTNVASIPIGFAMYGMNLIAPQVLQLPAVTGYGLGQTMLQAGLWMAPAGLVMMAVSPVSARLSRARGPKMSLLTGVAIIAAGNLLGQALMGSAWGVLAFAVIIATGIAMAYAAMPALIMAAVPLSETAAANGLNSLARSLGTSTASAVIGAILGQLTMRLGPVAVPSFAGIRVCLAICAGGALLAGLIVLAIPGRKRPAGPVPAPAPEPALAAGEPAPDAA